MAKTMIDKMVDRFLGWKLPQDFGPDCGISFTPFHPNGTTRFEPVGTNLFTADQARSMVKHMMADALPADTDAYATEEEGDAYTHGYFDGNDAAALKINAG